MKLLKEIVCAVAMLPFAGCGYTEFIAFSVENKCDKPVTVECRYKQELLPSDSVIVHKVYDLPRQLDDIPEWVLVYYGIPSEVGRAEIRPEIYAGEIRVEGDVVRYVVEPQRSVCMNVKRKYVLNNRNVKMIAGSLSGISVKAGGKVVVYSGGDAIKDLLLDGNDCDFVLLRIEEVYNHRYYW